MTAPDNQIHGLAPSEVRRTRHVPALALRVVNERRTLVRDGRGATRMTKPDRDEACTGMQTDPFLEISLPGSSPAMVALRATIMKLNASRNTGLVRVILLRGESGAGKNHVARAIAAHQEWTRVVGAQGTSGGPQLAGSTALYSGALSEVLLPAVPDQLIESELFGHKKGAFTGADSDREGRLSGGGSGHGINDILLDEIGDASPRLQASLLHVLETGKFTPLGGGPADEETVSARLILATNRDLEAMCCEGTFRKDLYWRIALFIVDVPPLREQPENIGPLAKSILTELAGTRAVNLDDETVLELSSAELKWAKAYAWPGNVRQLQHVLKRWLVEDGLVALADVAASMKIQDLDRPAADQAGSPSARVRARLTAAMREGGKPVGTLNALLKEQDAIVKSAVVEWYRNARPDADDLERVFPDALASSVRTKISQWGQS